MHLQHILLLLNKLSRYKGPRLNFPRLKSNLKKKTSLDLPNTQFLYFFVQELRDIKWPRYHQEFRRQIQILLGLKGKIVFSYTYFKTQFVFTITFANNLLLLIFFLLQNHPTVFT